MQKVRFWDPEHWRIRGRYETRWKPMQCECVVDRPNQGLVRCANKSTQRLSISHLKIRLLACEACGARQLAWAEPYRNLPGLVVVEPAAPLASASKSLAQINKSPDGNDAT